jgi:hypothetical protein
MERTPWIIQTRKGWFDATTQQYYPTYEEALEAYKAEVERTKDCPF